MSAGNIYELVIGVAAAVGGACLLWASFDFAPRRLSVELAKEMSERKKKFGWLYMTLGPLGLIWGAVHIFQQF